MNGWYPKKDIGGEVAKFLAVIRRFLPDQSGNPRSVSVFLDMKVSLGRLSGVLTALGVLVACGGGSTPSTPTTASTPAPTPTPTPNLPRTTTERPDDVGGYQVKIVYALPSDGVDRNYDTNGTIAGSVRSAQAWFRQQSGGKAFQMDTSNGSFDIIFLRLDQTNAQYAARGTRLRDDLERVIRAQPFFNAQKMYVVYYQGANDATCGGGAWPPALIGNVVALYLEGAPPGFATCASNTLATENQNPRYWEFVFLHEIFHGLGAAPTCAPNHTLSGHTSDSNADLMYAGNQPWNPSVLDLNKDDYYGHSRAGCVNIANSIFLTPPNAGAAPPPGW
jgi:hypothetical protein